MRIDRFLGIAPAIAPMHLPTAFAQEAVNCYSDKGYAITPTRAPSYIDAPIYNPDGTIFTGTPRRIWLSGSTWVGWDTWVEVCADPREWGSTNAFLYVDTSGTLMRCSDQWILDGTGPKAVGIARPGVFPSASLPGITRGWSVDPGNGLSCTTTDTLCGGDQQPPEPRSYMFTVVNDMDEESPPSEASDVIYVPHDQVVSVAAPGPAPAGTVKYRWYRTLALPDGTGEWLFIRETSTPLLLDSYDALQLGDPLTTLTAYQPEGPLSGVARVGHANVIVWTEAGHIWTSHNRLPHAYSMASRQQVDFPIVTVRSTPSFMEGGVSTEEMGESFRVFVLTQGQPYIGMYRPDANDELHLDLRTVAMEEGCLSPWGAVVAEGTCFYVSDRGVVRLTTEGAESIMDREFSREYWTVWQPHTMTLAFESGVLFGFQPSGGWVLPISTYLRDREPILSRTTVNATAAYCDPKTKLVLAAPGGTLMHWRGATSMMKAVWWSSEWQMPEYWNPGAVKIDANIHSLRSSHADKAWALFKDWIARNGACSGPDFYEHYPEFQDCRGFIHYMLDPIKVEIFREGKLYAVKHVVSERPMRLPRQGKGIYWSIRITTPIPVFRVMVDKAIRDMASPVDPNGEG